MHNRCYNKKNQAYSSYGAKGIAVDWVWHRDNPDGMVNFLEWLDISLKEAEHPAKWIVMLRDQTKNYGPTNCAISTQQTAVQRRKINSYSVEQVIAMRRYKKAHPETKQKQLAEMFGGTESSISQALTGVTYSNVDLVEPPIPFKYKRPPRPPEPELHPNASIFALADSLS